MLPYRPGSAVFLDPRTWHRHGRGDGSVVQLKVTYAKGWFSPALAKGGDEAKAAREGGGGGGLGAENSTRGTRGGGRGAEGARQSTSRLFARLDSLSYTRELERLASEISRGLDAADRVRGPRAKGGGEGGEEGGEEGGDGSGGVVDGSRYRRRAHPQAEPPPRPRGTM